MVFAAPPVSATCQADLARLGVRFKRWPVATKRLQGRPVCHVPAGVRVLEGPGRIEYNIPPKVNCRFALRLLPFERAVQRLAKKHLGARVTFIHQMGTYACRSMAAYPKWISEHAFANAIDIKSFRLADGAVVDVKRDFPKGLPKGSRAPTAKGRFLVDLARELYDKNVFSVVLTPNYDALHHNHFHLDGAHYRVDGT